MTTATHNVVITGSTKGIGRALAAEFAARGHQVVVTGRRRDDVDAAVAALSATAAGSVLGSTVEVSDPDAHEALWEFAVGKLGRVDIWVNNAGVAHTTAPIVATTPEAVQAMVSTNMLGTVFGSQTAVRGMTAQGGGRLFNVLGGGSDGRIRPHMGVYGATKRGLDMFTRALVKEVDGTGVTVGQIRPGILITDGWLREAAAAPEQVSSQRRILNILTDHVEDVAPELVERMLASTRNGDEIAWLTTGRMTRRFLTPGFAKKHDVLARYGL
ncbi:SDR family oxidoreductase [Nocardioides sp. BGMRC 2183]|nr:SDR family oxidoreductase [Nocardioides sp. BGMRC 2183]